MKPQPKLDELREISPSNILTVLVIIVLVIASSYASIKLVIWLFRHERILLAINLSCFVWAVYLVWKDAKGEEL